jgi:hypothetical protein
MTPFCVSKDLDGESSNPEASSHKEIVAIASHGQNYIEYS